MPSKSLEMQQLDRVCPAKVPETSAWCIDNGIKQKTYLWFLCPLKASEKVTTASSVMNRAMKRSFVCCPSHDISHLIKRNDWRIASLGELIIWYGAFSFPGLWALSLLSFTLVPRRCGLACPTRGMWPARRTVRGQLAFPSRVVSFRHRGWDTSISTWKKWGQ